MGGKFLIWGLAWDIAIVPTRDFTFEAINVWDLFSEKIDELVKSIASAEDVG